MRSATVRPFDVNSVMVADIITVVAVMTKGGPNESTNFLSYYAYQLFDQGRYGEATAMATVLFALVLALAWLAMYLQGAQRGKV